MPTIGRVVSHLIFNFRELKTTFKYYKNYFKNNKIAPWIKLNSMITLQQFDTALKIIIDYKQQLENGIIINKPEENYIDIQKKITTNTFFVLQNYFKDYHNFDLDWKSLSKMDIEVLQAINFKILRSYRGFGEKAEKKLREIILSNTSEMGS